MQGDPVGAGRVDRGVAVEGVGVVATPLLVRADDLDEAGTGGVGPQVHLGRHLEDGEHPLVGLEQGVGLVGQLLDHAGVRRGHGLEQLAEGLLGLGRHVFPPHSAWRRS